MKKITDMIVLNFGRCARRLKSQLRLTSKPPVLALVFLLLSFQMYGQFYERNERKIVFTDEVNIRASASAQATMLGTFKQRTQAIVCSNLPHVPDTINSVISNWVPVLYKDNTGYIWGADFSSNSFQHTNGNQLLVKTDSKGLVYKIFNGEKLIVSGTYPDIPYSLYVYIYQIQPLDAVSGNIYFKIADSDIIYAFDSKQVIKHGLTTKDNMESIHQSAREEIKDSLGSIINSNQVNVRSNPDKNAPIIAVLSKYTFVEEIERLQLYDSVTHQYNSWHKIKWQDKSGYVWGKFISTPLNHIYDNNDRHTTYLLCHNALFVLHDREITTHCMLQGEVYDETLHSFGDMGFGKGYDFVAVEYMAYSCGETGGDMYYLWDGKKINYFCFDYEVGDGGMGEGERYSFTPSPQGGLPKIVKTSYSAEMIDIVPLNDCEANYTDAIYHNTAAMMKYTGDTLVEVPSIFFDVKQMIQNKFPGYEPVQYEFGDINGDKIEDVLFHARKDISSEVNDYGEYEYSYTNKTKIGIAFGKAKGGFELFSVNEKIIADGSSILTLSLNGKELMITAYVFMEKNEWDDYTYTRKIYNFTYNNADKKIYWESVVNIDRHGMEKFSFKTQKVLFENAWDYVVEHEEEYEQEYEEEEYIEEGENEENE